MFRKQILVVVLLTGLLACLPRVVSAQEATATPEAGDTETVPAPTTVIEEISSPASGTLLTGGVEIRGTALAAWELAFSYQDNPTNTWFLLAQSSDPVTDGVLAGWDTNSIADGSYVLRLRISGANGPQDLTVSVRVGNSLPDETATPTVTLTVVPEASVTVTPTAPDALDEGVVPALLVTPTRLPVLPANPAVLNTQDVFTNLGKGVLGVVVIFFVAGLAWALRRR